MNISEILSDALVYPINNIKALLIYVVLGIIAGIAVGGTLLGFVAGAKLQNGAISIVGIFGLLISIVLVLLITGYELDIVKYGINRDPGAPGIDIVRQVVNAIKLIIVEFVYYIIPILIAVLIGVLFGNGIISTLIAIIICIIFSLALFMAVCRLAKTDDLGDALAVGEAIGDISRVGLINILLLSIILVVIAFVAMFIISLIAQASSTIGSILLGIFSVYFSFAGFRAIGLLYSNA